MDLSAIREPRPRTLSDGAGPARERAAQLDAALASLCREAYLEDIVAVVAVGGYGRSEVSPRSDVDLLLVVSSTRSEPSLKDFLYPLWDARFKVGHAVRTPKDAVASAQRDLHAATALLSARFVAGRRDLFDELDERLHAWLQRERKSLVLGITRAVRERQTNAERAGWMLAPDIKNDIGGLRDAHASAWLAAVAGSDVPPTIAASASTLVAVREALHGVSSRQPDHLRMDLQPEVASLLGLEGDRRHDELMGRVHDAARSIETESLIFATSAVQAARGPRRSGWTTSFGGGIRHQDGELVLDPETDDLTAAGIALLRAHAETGRPVASGALHRLRGWFHKSDRHWNDVARRAFLDLLRDPHARSALELGDRVGAWSALLPGWTRVRALAQHDPYHRYTVDGHLFVTVEEIGTATREDPLARNAFEEADSTDAVYLAALLHDVGKGSGEDHSVEGERIARAICVHIGVDDTVRDTVSLLVRHHLLLVDTATRRDLSDGEVIAATAAAVGSPDVLRLLYVLTVADGLATGPNAWGAWKAALVQELYGKTLVAVETGKLPGRNDVRSKAAEVEAYEPALAGRAIEILETLPPSYLSSATVADMADELRLMFEEPGPGEVRHRVFPGAEAGQQVLSVCAPDQPGTLARTAGVLALNRVDVLAAEAYSTTSGLALERFVVRTQDEAVWDRFGRDLVSAYAGRLALDARLDRKAADYDHNRAAPIDVRVISSASARSTVIEVRALDRLGLLYSLASAVTSLGLDIHLAKIDTLGERVVDVFYVRTPWGSQLDEEHIAELRSALHHAVSRLGGDSP